MSLKAALTRMRPENRERRRLETALAALAATSGQAEAQLDAVAGLIGWLRPLRVQDKEGVSRRLELLIETVRADAPVRALVRGALRRLVQSRQPLRLLSDSGMLANEGFFSGMSRRLSQRWLPDELDLTQLKDALNHVFSRRDDHLWVAAVTNASWVELLDALDFGVDGDGDGRPSAQGLSLQILEALLVVSYRIAAMGLEPELVRNHPQIERYESPFLAQNAEMRRFIDEQRLARSESRAPRLDDRHLLVLLGQCEEIVAKVRRQAASSGASVTLTILLVRLAQHIDRLELLLHLLEPRPVHELNQLRVRIFKQVVRAENRRNSVREQWRQTLDLLAARITQNASKRGENYVTTTRSEYFQMLRSALGAGFIVSFMAMIKIGLGGEPHSPLGGAVLYSLNYGLGFVLIYMLNFTIATKQPAMTASYLAASLAMGKQDGSERLDRLTEQVVRTLRSQFVAIFGNVLLAFTVPVALAYAIRLHTGADFLDAKHARELMSAQNPLESLAWFHAALAGVCLFAAGLISGYFDNKAVYNRIPQRLLQLRGLRRLLGERSHRRLAAYVEDHLGALAGNFFFGCMLGTMGTLGYIIGLPLDIRHVTFSSAYFGYSAVALDWSFAAKTGVLVAIGVLGIGLINLLVSFALALWVAMRAQGVPSGSARGLLLRVGRRFLIRPGEFFLPPKAAPTPAAQEAKNAPQAAEVAQTHEAEEASMTKPSKAEHARTPGVGAEAPASGSLP